MRHLTHVTAKQTLLTTAKYLDALPTMTFRHMVSERYKKAHKIKVGVGVMFTGVMIANAGLLFNSLIAHITLDIVGYLIHGVGAVPIAEHYISKVKDVPASIH